MVAAAGACTPVGDEAELDCVGVGEPLLDALRAFKTGESGWSLSSDRFLFSNNLLFGWKVTSFCAELAF